MMPKHPQKGPRHQIGLPHAPWDAPHVTPAETRMVIGFPYIGGIRGICFTNIKNAVSDTHQQRRRAARGKVLEVDTPDTPDTPDHA